MNSTTPDLCPVTGHRRPMAGRHIGAVLVGTSRPLASSTFCHCLSNICPAFGHRCPAVGRCAGAAPVETSRPLASGTSCPCRLPAALLPARTRCSSTLLQQRAPHRCTALKVRVVIPQPTTTKIQHPTGQRRHRHPKRTLHARPTRLDVARRTFPPAESVVRVVEIAMRVDLEQHVRVDPMREWA
jgi:hypothetical protein